MPLGFWVFLCISCFFVFLFFFLVLGLGFGGGSSYFKNNWGLDGFPGVCFFFDPFLFFVVRFFLLSSGFRVFLGGFFLIWGSGWFSWGLGFFCFFLVSSCSLFFLGGVGGFSWDLFFFSCSSLVSSGSFFSCFGVLGGLPVFVSSCCFFFLVFLVPFLVLLVPYLLVIGAWMVFLGFGGSSCSFLVCSCCSLSSCFGGPGWSSWGLGVLLVPFLFLLEEEDEEKDER